MDETFRLERVAKLKTLIIATEDAILALTSGGHDSYELMTGQGRQRVTRLDIDKLKNSYKAYMEMLAELEATLEAGSTVQATMRW